MMLFHNVAARRWILQAKRRQMHQNKSISTFLASSSSSASSSGQLLSSSDVSCLLKRKRERGTSIIHQNSRIQLNQQQKRTFLPLIPALTVGVFAVGGWIAYRKSQAKPVAPDQALAAQEAYRKEQERLQQKQHQGKKENQR